MGWENIFCKKNKGNFWPVYLWVLINFLGVFLIAVNVKPDGCPGTACPAETEDDARAIREDDPQTLKKHEDRKQGWWPTYCFAKHAHISMKLRKVFRLNISKTVGLDGIFMSYFKHKVHHEAILSTTVMQNISNFIREIISTNIYIAMSFQYLSGLKERTISSHKKGSNKCKYIKYFIRVETADF